jgi:hypothetical protein
MKLPARSLLKSSNGLFHNSFNVGMMSVLILNGLSAASSMESSITQLNAI